MTPGAVCLYRVHRGHTFPRVLAKRHGEDYTALRAHQSYANDCLIWRFRRNRTPTGRQGRRYRPGTATFFYAASMDCTSIDPSIVPSKIETAVRIATV